MWVCWLTWLRPIPGQLVPRSGTLLWVCWPPGPISFTVSIFRPPENNHVIFTFFCFLLEPYLVLWWESCYQYDHIVLVLILFLHSPDFFSCPVPPTLKPCRDNSWSKSELLLSGKCGLGPIHCGIYFLSSKNCLNLDIFGFQLLQIAPRDLLFCADSQRLLALTSQIKLALKDVCTCVLLK